MTPGDLSPLREGPKGKVPEVRNAYRYLRGAHKTVDDLFTIVEAESGIRRSLNQDSRGRMAGWEVDLLRSAIVFTSSGLDAAMARLVTDVGRVLVPIPGTGARAQYVEFVKRELSGATKVDVGLTEAITGSDPAEALLGYYLRNRTKASFQGSGDLNTRVRKTLGIGSARVPDDVLAGLDPFFTSRNSIVHGMDYVDPDKPKSTARTHRSRDSVAELCNTVFEVAADLMHAAAEVVIAARAKNR